MDQSEENSVEEEVATQESDGQFSQEEPQVDEFEQKQERNWREVRKQIAELKKQNQEKDELLHKVYEAQKNQQQPQEDPIDLDEYANYGGVQKVAKKTVEPLMKEVEQLKNELTAARQKAMFSEIRQKYPDFDDVINSEMIALFEEKEPELAESIAGIKDPYAMTLQTYKFIKSSGLLDDLPNKKRQKEAKKMLEKNSKTVQSPQVFDKRPMAQAFRLTNEEKSKLWEEMNQYGQMASSVPPLS